ncbi:hypothetical protein BPNPMPFG_002418 [Mesorhizobium sp. AR07]|uniref:DUF6894 family protein n=1 Tax=Mesorhizobium sp. AR07 TaxID=2865838 RepID=UPI002160B2DF|nr:hypothetical protein [Mesorhizobium sp. AR07]UVK46715.1 hypothetical protein BPNPMPFG_002418 [Mesorhizobium sp. AR07]
MPLYYFDVDDNGETLADDQGTECVDFSQVKTEATRALVEMMKDVLPDGDHHMMKIRVRNDGGMQVLQIALQFDVESENRGARRSTE